MNKSICWSWDHVNSSGKKILVWEWWNIRHHMHNKHVSDAKNYVHTVVEEHCSLGGSIISRLDNGAFVGLIYSLLVFS